jgi:hypothetical protein
VVGPHTAGIAAEVTQDDPTNFFKLNPNIKPADGAR